MSDWDGTGDQYHIDIDSRYPLFSDIQTTDYSINTAPKPVQLQRVHSYESKYQYEQQDVPAVLTCKCGTCPMRDQYLERDKIRRLYDERDAILQLQHDAIMRTYKNISPNMSNTSIQPITLPNTITLPNIITLPNTINLDNNMIFMIFIFIIVLVICTACMKSISDLKETLRQLVSHKAINT